ncbi:MAG TPA: beta-glycosidase, partial [Bacteroidales bacterium]|nr:beta-glycosidase [Bacteroidales bacterium]
ILDEALIWKILDINGENIHEGELPKIRIPNKGLTDAGEILFPLGSLKSSDKLRITLSLKSSGYSNSYSIWVYPARLTAKTNGDIFVASRLSNDVLAKLRDGEKVLLFPKYADVKNNSVGGLFIPEFWNYGMFKGISEWVKKPVSPGTLGILTDPEHPIFNSFPTDFHTNWQWFSIIKASNPLILNKTDKEFRPIVQTIDNLERNYKLGLIFEFAVGNGKLLVCMSRLDEMTGKPEAVALYNSIMNYMLSESFNPSYSVDEKLLKELFK